MICCVPGHYGKSATETATLQIRYEVLLKPAAGDVCVTTPPPTGT